MTMDQAKINWDINGLPHSALFDDKYFSDEDGLLESEYTFCQGNGLYERFRKYVADQPEIFTIVETGFGTGLNFLCAWKLFKENAPDTWKLNYISIDRYPFSAGDLSRASSLWPQLNHYSYQLLEQYGSLGDLNRPVWFDEKRVSLTVIFKDAFDALADLAAKGILVDAWFLDGFAPSKNPGMWSNEVFALMGAMSRSGSTCATFTVAGSVCRGLKAQGFKVEKVKGFGRKRHMLKGKFLHD